MEIVFSAAELCRAMPPPGRYGAVIDNIEAEPSGPTPRVIDLRLRVTRPADRAGAWLVDRLVLRGRDQPPLAGLRRMLRLLHRANIRVRADEPIALDRLVGLEVWVDVEAGVGSEGFPASRIADYHLLVRPPVRP